MAKDTCLACGHPFPANKELASVPLARLVAYDPDALRVWRICEPCAHWNLLGPEAARAAIPELMARSEAAASAGGPGFGMVVTESNTLLLFRIGASASRDASRQKAAALHAELGRGIRLTWRGGLQALGIIAGCGALFFAMEQLPLLNAVLTSDSLKTLWWSPLLSWLALARTEHFRQGAKPMRWLWLLMVPMLIWEWHDSTEPWWLLAACLAVGLFIGIRAGVRGGRPRGIRWADGTDHIRFQWAGAPEEHGWTASTLAVFDLSTEFTDPIKPADREVAWSLWNQHESLTALLKTFEAQRDDSGLLRFTHLTVAERFALLIAIGARLAEPPAEVVAGLEEAERIAAIAESLDRQLAEPA